MGKKQPIRKQNLITYIRVMSKVVMQSCETRGASLVHFIFWFKSPKVSRIRNGHFFLYTEVNIFP